MKKSTTSTAETHGNGNRSETSSVLNSKGNKHDANLRKNGFIHFQIGLIVAMLLVYFGLEYALDKRTSDIPIKKEDLTEVYEIHPDVYVYTVETEVKPQQKVRNSYEYTIKPDDYVSELFTEYKSDPVVESSSAISLDSIIVPPSIEEDMVFPIAAVDAPIFPGCENVEKSMQRACFEEKIQKHVIRNFRYPDTAIETRTQGKVYVMFTIGKNGLIEDVKLKGPAKVLENEAGRIIDKLPQMKPGKRLDKPVKVSFSLPINFQLN